MLRPDDPWFPDEDVDEFIEMLKALPEIRQHLEPAPRFLLRGRQVKP